MGGLFGGDAAAKAQQEAAAQSAALQAKQMEQFDKAAEYYESIGVPPEEAQKIALEAAQLDPSAMEGIEIDPRLKEAQMGALGQMQEMGKGELTAEEKAQEMMITRGAGAQAQAQDKAILQDMAQKGMGGSGNELIQRLQASQSSADRASQQQAQLAGQTQSRALEAISQAGQLGGQMRGQSFGEQAQQASAADRIAEFNAKNRAQEEMHNKGLAERKFQQEMQLAGSKANVKTGAGAAYGQHAQSALQAGQNKAQGALASGAATGKLLGSVIGAGASFAGKKADGGVLGQSFEDGGTAKKEEEKEEKKGNKYADLAANLSRSLAQYGVGQSAGMGDMKAQDLGFDMIDTAPDRVVAPDRVADPYGADLAKAKLMALNAPSIPSARMVSPQERMAADGAVFAEGGMVTPNSNGGFAGGGVPVADSGMEYEEGDVVPGDDFEGDRVDAKVNSGEMVINVEQQQRLMELLRGLRDLKGLGSEDIVEPEEDANMAVEQSLPAPEMAPEQGVDPATLEALRAAQGGSPAPGMEDGGMVPSDYQTPTEAKPRGLHATLKYEKEQEIETKDKEKHRKARIKAYETLINGGK